VAQIGELSVREPGAEAGGGVVDAFVPGDSDSLEGKGCAVLFVHGYNNSRAAARGSFEGFVKGLEAATGRGMLPWPVFGVQWPGDEPNAAISALSYPLKIKVAQRAADKIFDYLRGIFGPGGAPITLHVVAHSLGCRLTLELLEKLARGNPAANVVVTSVTLMAAAVPVGKVEPDGRLRRGVDAANRVCVLHSTGDAVLHWAFPIGQTAGGDGFFPTAIGRFGGPSGVWTRSASMSAEGKLYGHSSYWQGVESASAAAAMMGVAVANPIPVSLTPSHELPPPNTIVVREVAGRRLPQ
jgi:pimeloyl-ACP methyl ester carboxylesterase